MRCAQAQKLIPLFANGELQELRQREVENHLRDCAACRKMADEYAAVARIAGTGSPVAEPEGFYDKFYDDVLARTTRNRQSRAVAASKKSAWPVFRPRLAFAGAALAIVIFALLFRMISNSDRLTLEDYLRARDFAALTVAMENPDLRVKLIDDSVSVDLLAASLKALERMNAQHGQVGKNVDQVILLIQQEMAHTRPAAAFAPASRRPSKVIHATMLPDRIDLKNLARAIRLIQRPGLKVTLHELFRIWMSVRKSYQERRIR